MTINHGAAQCIQDEGTTIPSETTLHSPSREIRKTLRHCRIDFAPERHHEFRTALQPFPSPSVEFRRLAVARGERIDLIVAAGKAQREPFLSLAAKSCEPGRRSVIGPGAV